MMRNHRTTMLTMLAVLGLFAAATATPLAAQEPPVLTATEAASHVGEVATVCGKVASATYARGSRGQPTFLNLDQPYPRHVFTAVIWVANRVKFPTPPERTFWDENICVTGLVETYRGKPQIEVSGPEQIREQ